MEKLSSVAKTLAPSPIQQLSFLAQRCNAINLAEGFPDFVAPAHIKNAAVLAINSDFNQYRFHLVLIRKKCSQFCCPEVLFYFFEKNCSAFYFYFFGLVSWYTFISTFIV